MSEKRLIMVVDRKTLFGNDHFEGFRPFNEIDYEAKILTNFKYMEEDSADKDPTYKQPIRYVMIVNPTLKKVFAYQRSKQDHETRLRGKWSWGIGGHVEKLDIKSKNPIHTSMLRELKEEAGINSSINPKVLGYINLEFDVHAVHFGILYIIETDSKVIKSEDPEITNGRFRTIEELNKICSSPKFIVEEWSRISLEQLKSYLLKTN